MPNKILSMLIGESVPIFIFQVCITYFLGIIQQWVLYELLTPKKPGSFFRPLTFIMAAVYDIFLQSVSFLYAFDFVILVNHLILVIPLLIYCCFLKGGFTKKLLMTLITLTLGYIVSDLFVVFWLLLGFSMEAMHESNLIFVGTTIVVHIIIFAVNVLFVKFYKKIHYKLNKLETFQIMLILVLTFVFLLVSIHTTYVVNDTRISMFMLITTVCLISLTLVTYFMIFKISKNNYIEQENALLRMEKEYQKQKYENIIRQSEQIKKLRHDYKNNLLVIRSLAEDKNTEDVIDFVSQGIERINATKMHIETNNEIVNAIVNTKMSAAAEQGIKVSFISISDFDGVEDFDLCNLISNLFDNAITAVSSCENKIIEIKISRNDGLYTIKMSNTISESVIEANPYLMSTKEDNIYHGYGTKIIKDIADKYNGELDYYEEDGMFNFLVHLASKQPVISAVPV